VARLLAGPALATLAITAVLFLLGLRNWVALTGGAICCFALLVTLLEILRGLRARHARGEGWPTATRRLFSRNRRRYGGYVAHIGITLLAMGILGSTVYQVQAERSLAEGESLDLGGYRLTYGGMGQEQLPDQSRIFARVEVSRDGQIIGTLTPSKETFRQREDQPMTIPSILHRPGEDVYTLFGAFDPDTGRATIKAFVNPLIQLVWFGLIVLLFGTVIAAWPDAVEERVMNAELKRLTGGVSLPVQG
jgi:cytochrome c-type biogenesis protein CcmF